MGINNFFLLLSLAVCCAFIPNTGPIACPSPPTSCCNFCYLKLSFPFPYLTSLKQLSLIIVLLIVSKLLCWPQRSLLGALVRSLLPSPTQKTFSFLNSCPAVLWLSPVSPTNIPLFPKQFPGFPLENPQFPIRSPPPFPSNSLTVAWRYQGGSLVPHHTHPFPSNTLAVQLGSSPVVPQQTPIL